MHILYISTLCSQRFAAELFSLCPTRSSFAVQKFHSLISKGLLANGVDVQTLTAIPVTSKYTKKKVWNIADEVESGIHFKYIPFVTFPCVRHLCLFFYSFIYAFIWGLSKKNEKRIFCDVLNVSVCLGALLASKLNGMKTVGVMTDMPGLMVGDKKNKIHSIVSFINKKYISSFSFFIFLTEAMNDVINLHHRPYIVMEGLVDSSCSTVQNNLNGKLNEKVILYAGGLHERYGLDMLVRAFMKLRMDDARLVIYGNGPYVEKLKKNAKLDNRIVYKGVRPNAEVVADEISATLLVNPRPTAEEFTRYSFPSKNMEYMASGTPLLTTKLPGMPQEYYPYVYTFEKESIDGYLEALQLVLSKTREELRLKGISAQKFIVEKKNNVCQCQRIINLIKNNK